MNGGHFIYISRHDSLIAIAGWNTFLYGHMDFPDIMDRIAFAASLPRCSFGCMMLVSVGESADAITVSSTLISEISSGIEMFIVDSMS